MKPVTTGPLAALARVWRAVARAFTPTDARASQQYGADTTLFGSSIEQPRSPRAPDGIRNEFWVPGETTDYSELDPERDSGHRRRER